MRYLTLPAVLFLLSSHTYADTICARVSDAFLLLAKPPYFTTSITSIEPPRQEKIVAQRRVDGLFYRIHENRKRYTIMYGTQKHTGCPLSCTTNVLIATRNV